MTSSIHTFLLSTHRRRSKSSSLLMQLSMSFSQQLRANVWRSRSVPRRTMHRRSWTVSGWSISVEYEVWRKPNR